MQIVMGSVLFACSYLCLRLLFAMKLCLYLLCVCAQLRLHVVYVCTQLLLHVVMVACSYVCMILGLNDSYVQNVVIFVLSVLYFLARYEVLFTFSLCLQYSLVFSFWFAVNLCLHSVSIKNIVMFVCSFRLPVNLCLHSVCVQNEVMFVCSFWLVLKLGFYIQFVFAMQSCLRYCQC